MTYTANGVPKRALIRVRRSSKTGMASEKMKTRIPVMKTEPLFVSGPWRVKLTSRLSSAARYFR